MFLYKNRIVVTGGTGRFGNELMKIKHFLLIINYYAKINNLNGINAI
mgnify:CR=1 FL=1